MEDDDEFGDLYTDVLTPFSDPSPFQPPQPPRSEPVPPPIDNTPAAASISRLSSDEGDVLRATSSSNPRSSLSINLNLDPTINLNESPPEQTNENTFSPSRASEDPQLLGSREFRGVSSNSPSAPSDVEAAETRVLGNLDFDMNTDVAAANHEGDENLDHSAAPKDVECVDKGDNWGAQVEHEDDVPVIPGISISPPNDGALNLNGIPQEEANDQGDDWDSDSDDDLQIVLNENDHPDIHHYQGPGAMGDNSGKVDDDDDEDEDGDPLVIVTDIDAVHHHPPPEEQGWGEDSGQAPDGEGKEAGEAGKANGGVSMPTKIGYNSYGYHQYHSQFKYVRPGAAPLPGGPGVAGQVRPPVNMGVVGGRGRGDWRPVGMKGSLQKGFQSGFWGSNASGRGFGGDFTLPSQKTIFDISIDSFEEKPWNQPGADVSDFFNFGLNEDSWKEYCKKLEQLRMESTMKSKAHVLVVGSHSEQEYDPDLPPELAAAAAGIQHHSAGNSNTLRADVGQIDIAKGSNDMRPVLPTGRPIQVETGAGERIPSIDTRPPRMRDPDSVIEGSIDDDSSAGYGATDVRGNDVSREEDGEQTRNIYSDGSPQSLDRTKKDDARRPPQASPSHDDMPEDESSLPPEAPIEHSSSSRDKSPVYLSDKFDAPHGERQRKGKIHESSRSTSPVQSAPDEKFVVDKQDVSNENMEGSASPHALSLEERVFSDDEPFETEGNDPTEKEDVISNENSLGSSKHRSTRKLKLGSQVEHVSAKETDDVSYVKAASSDNSRATGSSQDLQKRNNVVDDEGGQDEHSSHARDLNRNRRGDFQSHHRKDRDGSLETEKISNMTKKREHHRNSDTYPPHSSLVKSEGLDRRRERDYPDGILQQGGEDLFGRKYRAEDLRKNDNADGVIARHRGKVREGERSSKDEYPPSRKLMENGNWRGHHEKDAVFRIKDKDTRYENMDDPHRKRRKDDEHARRDHFQQDEIMRSNRDISGHSKREESLDRRKREDLRRRDAADDHRPIRSKDESWLQRERVEQRHRERDDGYRPKQPYEESLSRREREDGRAPIRSGRVAEEKGRTGHSRKDNYKANERDSLYKDTGRNGEQLKRKDRAEDASNLQYGYEEKRSRQDKPIVRSDRAVLASDSQRAHERRPKENSRRPKPLEGAQQSASNSLKKPHEDKIGRNEMAGLTGTTEEGNPEKMEEASDVDQHRSKRGRSKLERWGSHHETERDDLTKKTQPADISLSVSEGKETSVSKEKESDMKHIENRHLDTVAKLKKRSERFKLPMPIEKDTTTIKKMENEPLPSAPSEAPGNSEMKPERPPRKRRWISCRSTELDHQLGGTEGLSNAAPYKGKERRLILVFV
ncbi:hypothetical protein V2J09_009607 [Rumex salicifolius]